MATTPPGPSVSQRTASLIVVAILAMIAVPAGITLHTVRHPATLTVPENPSPYGYTWSLLLFIVPIVVIAFWFVPRERIAIPKRAFWRTIGILAPLGFGLDFFFACRFFVFPNRQATLQIDAPALGRPVPVEEYIFYFTGFVAVLLIYLWLDEFWLALYNVPDYKAEAEKAGRLLRFHPVSLVLAIALIGLAVVWKMVWGDGGFPGYFTVLVAGGLVPSAGFYPSVRSLINWRALGLTMFLVLLISLLWEATLALPYNWWNFQHPKMIGIFIGAWADLPIEEIFVWIAVTYATVIVFEVVKLWQASGRTMKAAFLG